jgi:hypothetical protein
MKNVTTTWKAFGKPTYSVIMIENDMADLEICEELFKATNLRAGWLWDALQYDIPADRTHTALSVGDEIDIDGTIYRCAPIGWDVVGTYEVDNFALSERDLH